RPLGAAPPADPLATNLGRYMIQGRWNELLDEALYTIAPQGAWDPRHPAWRPARAALAQEIRRASLDRLARAAGRLPRAGGGARGSRRRSGVRASTGSPAMRAGSSTRS